MNATTPRRPIEAYAMIGDGRTTAMIADDGTVEWWCSPRIDSDACFAALLGSRDNGHWLLAPHNSDQAKATRKYRDKTLVLETQWETPGGAVEVVDFMPPQSDTSHLIRIVRGLRGEVRMRSEVLPRFRYGNDVPSVQRTDPGWDLQSGPNRLHLASSVDVEPVHGGISGTFVMRGGDEEEFVLTSVEPDRSAGHLPDPQGALRDATDYWQDWIARSRYRGRWSEAVHRSLLTLAALIYQPTGGLVAAATTSLPEHLGGVRNWDYRYCWLRDATFALQALIGTGYVEEARNWREWLIQTISDHPDDLQIVYSVDGSRRLPESDIDWLPGYAGSRPVRIGNQAAGQRQLDVWGEVLTGLHLIRESGVAPSEAGWQLQRDLLDWLEGNWQEPDNGLWEVRSEQRQFVHSKVMAWAGFDRAVRAVEGSSLDGELNRWRAIRRQIHDEVCTRGFDPDRGTFTQFYGSRGVDAALLLLPRVGFLAWDDPRMRGTLTTVERELGRDALLARYDPDADRVDGLPHGEGAFLACSFWHADALWAVGRRSEAEDLFETLLGLRNDVGLLSEEYDLRTARQLGNTPQAFSMVGVINTARHLGGEPMQTSRRPTNGTRRRGAS